MNSKGLGKKITHFMLCVLLLSWSAHAGNIDPGGTDDKYAWGENIGWVSFSSSGAAPFRIVTAWRPDTGNNTNTAGGSSGCFIQSVLQR